MTRMNTKKKLSEVEQRTVRTVMKTGARIRRFSREAAQGYLAAVRDVCYFLPLERRRVRIERRISRAMKLLALADGKSA